jgi:hypothetical protein
LRNGVFLEPGAAFRQRGRRHAKPRSQLSKLQKYNHTD